MAEIKIDMAKLDAAIRAGMPKAPVEKQPSEAKTAALEAFPSVKAGFASMGVIEDVQTTFCSAWPKVRPLIMTGLKFVAWFAPAQVVALAKSVVNAIDTVIAPALCGPNA